MDGFLLIVMSAFMHAFWNILLKNSDNKYIFNYQMHIVNLSIFSLVYPFVFSDYLFFDTKTVVISFAASIFFSLYHICISTAYRYEDASKVYPVTVASPFFVLIWATLFLNESVGILGGLGISIIVVGVVVVNGSRSGIPKLNTGMLWALASTFFYSIGSVIDKVGVANINFPLYVYSLTLYMTLFVFLFSLRKSNQHMAHFKKNYKNLLFAGVIIFMSFLSYRLGLISTKVTYASALRQVSALFGVLLGTFFLKEVFKVNRLFGAGIIIVGAVLIRLAM